MHRHYTRGYKYMTTSSTNSAERSHVVTYHLILSHCQALHFKCLACTCAMAMTPGPSDPSKHIESNGLTHRRSIFPSICSWSPETILQIAHNALNTAVRRFTRDSMTKLQVSNLWELKNEYTCIIVLIHYRYEPIHKYTSTCIVLNLFYSIH